MRELESMRAAVSAFEQRLNLVESAHWEHPTPCREWNVRELVEHVITGNNVAVALLAHRAAAAAEPGDADVARVFRSSAADQDQAFTAAAPDSAVDHPAGRLSTASFAVYRAGDIAVHTWDLARATGTTEQLGVDLVERALVPYTAWVATLDIDGLFDRPNERTGRRGGRAAGPGRRRRARDLAPASWGDLAPAQNG